MVKLIRSKGVGVYFCTQNPADIPDDVLSQLGNRVQHALRAYTPRDQKAVKVAADTFRPNPAFSTEKVISELGIGEALVSMLEDGGVPEIVNRTLIRPPSSRVGAITPDERKAVMAASPVGAIYDRLIDRESAAEVLAKKAQAKSDAQAAPAAPPRAQETPPAARHSNRESVGEAMLKSVARNVTGQLTRSVTRELVRGILGGIAKGL